MIKLYQTRADGITITILASCASNCSSNHSLFINYHPIFAL